MIEPMKKKSLTLIEIMIALGIASLLLGVLFPYFTQTIRLKKEIEKETSFVFAKAHVQERLTTLFSQISKPLHFQTTKEDEGPFKLEFRFNNGYTQNPHYRKNVMAYLYLKEDKLLLEIKGRDQSSHLEVLLNGVEGICFEFTDFNEGEFSIKNQWDKTALPLFCALKVTFPKREEVFYFRFKSLIPFQYSPKEKTIKKKE